MPVLTCRMKNLLFLLLILPFINSAQIIPTGSRVDWSKAGFEGETPDFSTVVDVTQFGAVPNDNTDDYPAVVSAIASLNGGPGVIYFPAGNYRLQSTITLRDSLVIRGAGSDSTTLTFNFGGSSANSFNVSVNAGNSYQQLTSGYTKDSRKLVVPNAQSFLTKGDMVEIRQENGAWDIQPASWANYSVGHYSRLDSVTADTVWLYEPLRIDLDSALNPELTRTTPITACGLECFKMIRVDSNSNGINYGVNFFNATNCWMRGVESERSICAHVAIDHSSHISITGCYFHDAYLYDGTSTRGYGVMIISHSGSNLVEDNIFKRLRHAMVVKQGANGNVFAYNYSIETRRSEPIPDYASDICLHGHYAFANLFEGNICQNLQIDIVWGPSGPYNTFFRNKVELYGIIMSSGTQQSSGQNFVGNDVTGSQILQGMYTLAGSGHFQHGNSIKGTITPTGTNTLNDVTYYLDTIPPFFWNISKPLPSVGIPNTPATDNVPARARYLNGGVVTRCAYVPYVDTTSTGITTIAPSALEIKSYTVLGGEIVLEIVGVSREPISVSLLNMAGQTVTEDFLKNTEGTLTHALNTGTLNTGVYLLQVTNGKNTVVRKVVLQQ